MAALSLTGRVVRAIDLAPLADVPVRLVGPAAALAGMLGVQPMRASTQITWTRRLTGFAGTRWDCWVSQVQNKVQGLTWEQFRDAALAYNPQLNADGRLFKPERAYLIPQNDNTPRACIETRTDAVGGYSFALGSTPLVGELQVELDDYARFVLPLAINGAITQPIALSPLGGASTTSGSMRSARADYPRLPQVARRVIGGALFMLGDDAQVFDALPSELRKMCYGAAFLANPNDFHYKDIVCADLVSIALRGAGLDIAWGGGANPHMADYYHPDRGNGKLVEIADPNDWLPGDVLVFGAGAPSSRAGHVSLYVGPFSGTDRSGKTYNLSDGVEVVEASMDFMMNGKEVGTGVVGRDLRGYCLAKKCYSYTWVRHVRLRELAGAFGR